MKFLILACIILGLVTEFAAADPGVERMVSRTAARYGVPPKLAIKVAQVETGNKCGVVGSHGERGPLQIKPQSAAGLGYKNIRAASCQRQLDAGMAHLLMCYKMARGNWYKTAACHNGGPGTLKKSRINYGIRQYVRMVMK